MSFEARAMSAAELDLAVEWAAREGWNPGLNDALAFRVADPAGFLVGLKDGVPLTSISVVRYGTDFGFLGFYIAIPEGRGQGLGRGCGQGERQEGAREPHGVSPVVNLQNPCRQSTGKL